MEEVSCQAGGLFELEGFSPCIKREGCLSSYTAKGVANSSLGRVTGQDVRRSPG